MCHAEHESAIAGHEEGSGLFDVEVKTVPAQRYVSKKASVRVPELSPFIEATIGELMAAGAEGAPFCIYHGPVNEQDDGPIEVGVPLADGDAELPGGEVACATVTAEEAQFPEILGAYDAIAAWAKENGRAFAGPPREVYLSAPDEPLHWEVVRPLAS
jgi:effector-binding domain-containing protein